MGCDDTEDLGFLMFLMSGVDVGLDPQLYSFTIALTNYELLVLASVNIKPASWLGSSEQVTGSGS